MPTACCRNLMPSKAKLFATSPSTRKPSVSRIRRSCANKLRRMTAILRTIYGQALAVPVQDAARQSSAIQTKCLPKSMPIAKSVLRRSSCPAIRISTNATCSRVMFCQNWNMAGWKFNPLTLPYVRPDPRQSMRLPARLVRYPLKSPAAYAASG